MAFDGAQWCKSIEIIFIFLFLHTNRINQFAVFGTPTGRDRATVLEFALLAVALTAVTLQSI